MFPDDSDTLNWGTDGVDPNFAWSEVTDNNPAGDRRFVQAAGPFTLRPGAINNITVGVVWARSTDGDGLRSLVPAFIALRLPPVLRLLLKTANVHGAGTEA